MSEQKSTPLQNKLDSAMVRLHRLCSQEDDDGIWDENGHEQRAKLFEWVFGINYNLPSCSFSTRTLRLIGDTGNVLYNHMNTEDYKVSQDDIQAVSGIAEDVRDALLDYQVGSNKPYTSHYWRSTQPCTSRWAHRYQTVQRAKWPIQAVTVPLITTPGSSVDLVGLT